MFQKAAAPEFVLDFAALETMRAKARQSPEQSEAEVARQFEALLLQMMLRSMRDASFKGGLFDNEQTRMMQSLHDEQLSLQLSRQGMGLAEMLVDQMRRLREAREISAQLAEDPGVARPLPMAAATPAQAFEVRPAAPAFELAAGAAVLPAAIGHPPVLGASHGSDAQRRAPRDSGALAPGSASAGSGGVAAGVLDSIREGARAAVRRGAEIGRQATADLPAHVEVFVRQLAPAAERVAEATGLPLRLILGQAALESGWGRQEIRHANGLPSHNLFGIKATAGWRGRTADVMTTEYVAGEAQRLKQSFRAYRSYEEGLGDYARLLTDNPRYRGVLEARNEVEAARRVQEAGYATDPDYANKLIAIMRQLPV
ncbi:MAG: flagellar assembly peptidoglycan hydrolase FlgJ [Pigmentiphaga sp.]|nr:flagellar assembly peptidoglycan hydrolase FlgJ [Pigmentiphaga sp.]